jgi:transposase
MAAMIFLSEIVTLDRFKNLDRLASFVGLVPGEHSTGETEVDTGLTPRRNVALRYILIECAWVAVRQDPALLQAFNEYSKRMPKNVAIIHIARKLLSRMRFVLKHNQPYVTGVVSSR